MYCCAVRFDLLSVQMCYINGNNSNPGSPPPSVPQDHYCIQDIPTHARRWTEFSSKDKQKGYLDAKDGDMGVRYTRDAIFKPQAIGFLRGSVSILYSSSARGEALTQVMLL
jgi:hypothetical protein